MSPWTVRSHYPERPSFLIALLVLVRAATLPRWKIFFENEVFPAIERELATKGFLCQVSASHHIRVHFFAVIMATVTVFVSFM
jgi:hypothetical protein